MIFQINVNNKFIVNGKEYGSVEEMPADIREAYNKAIEGGSITFNNVGAIITSNKIIFNGKEYASEDEMPEEIRILYKELMKTFSTSSVSIPSDNTMAITTAKNMKSQSTIPNIKPIVPETNISKRQFIIGASILALIVLLLYMLNIAGNR